MKKNVGTLDRNIRIVLGLAILGAGYYYQTLWGLIGLVPLITAFAGRCPAYAPFGISSCNKQGC